MDTSKGYVFDPSDDKVADIFEKFDGYIPMTDEESWDVNADRRWVFNKLEICERQRILAAPLGIEPPFYPVFVKPITNMLGLSTGAQLIRNEHRLSYKPGYFWMKYLEGQQLSTDVAVEDGVCKWFYSMEPKNDRDGSFYVWATRTTPKHIKACIENFISENLSDYTGITNIETIGRSVIECPLRMSGQFYDFYGKDWIYCAMALYKGQTWQYTGKDRVGVSYVVRVPFYKGNRKPKIILRKQLERTVKLYTYGTYLPWFKDQPLNALPDDGFSCRLIVINAKNMQIAKFAAKRIQKCIILGQN